MNVPHLDLSLHQLAWALCMGQEPSRHVLDRLNYLRQLGIPSAVKVTPGSGNRRRYNYFDLVEAGVALYGLNNGMKPADLKNLLVDRREEMKGYYKQALAEQPEAQLSSDWVRSRGKISVLLANSIELRMHDRYSSTPGKIEVGQGVDNGLPTFDMVEHISADQTVRLCPLTKLALQWTAWALEAPEVKPGRPARRDSSE